MRAASTVMALVLAGWGAGALSRLAAAMLRESSERALRVANQLADHSARRLALLERIAAGLEAGRGEVPSRPDPGLDRARFMAEIVRATRASEWAEAETRLKEFEVDFPEGPELSLLKEELAKARDGTVKEGLAQLDAARGANDANRVLDLHETLVPALNDHERASLETDLAKWFLSLIHRRLRTGKVQSDLVVLAARFAERFATTVEGASVRASLATLRRSVGLCPRCAQPYTGVLDACPQCLKRGTQPLAASFSDEDSNPPE
jgi:hypothetical protein